MGGEALGFSYYRYGRIKPCGVSGGSVYYTLPSGYRVMHSTQLQVEIPEQTNPFISETVAFLLYHEEKMYIGRYDGSISIYRMSDELLVGLNNWEAPKYVDTQVCGYYSEGSLLDEIHLDLRDRQTVYICGHGSEGLLSAPIEPKFDLHSASFSATVFGASEDYSIFNERGEPIEAKFWPLQEDVRSHNCRIFL